MDTYINLSLTQDEMHILCDALNIARHELEHDDEEYDAWNQMTDLIIKLEDMI